MSVKSDNKLHNLRLASSDDVVRILYTVRRFLYISVMAVLKLDMCPLLLQTNVGTFAV